MKKIALLLLLLPTISFAQILGLGKRLAEYKASNGKAYHEGDTIKLAQGSAPDGTFRYLQYGGWATFFVSGEGANSHNVERMMSGYAAVVKKMHSFKAHGIDKVVFAVGIGGVSNYDLWIEDAIASCEIVNCAGQKVQVVAAPQQADALDQLKKLKALLDGGAITQAEYDAQKKKILNQ